jgi:ABC-type spermidine/putrescine transport system permease subunit II
MWYCHEGWGALWMLGVMAALWVPLILVVGWSLRRSVGSRGPGDGGYPS